MRHAMAEVTNLHQFVYKRGDHSTAPYDPIFFRKIDVKVGTILLCMGRTTSNTRWRVDKIKSDQGYGRGMRSVAQVLMLRDRVTIRRLDVYESRTVSFTYLSYSAIWRLAD